MKVSLLLSPYRCKQERGCVGEREREGQPQFSLAAPFISVWNSKGADHIEVISIRKNYRERFRRNGRDRHRQDLA